ncbi:MAG: NAD(P)/FAD-dependent oxidoreductase [Candidatus Omnitrophica bacterium]|nr:NAD(P)/FAD-dependent oxidoreductase [Candidatus Omnitrophota bacterium]
MNESLKSILIVGAGPAGMACAHTLAKAGCTATVFEKEQVPGGLCRTLNFDGYLFDIGGHRFLTKSDEINQLWQDVLEGDLLRVKRLSRIYFRRRFFNYPLSFANTFANLGLVESFKCIASYFWCKWKRPGDDQTFEGWITNHFGKRLYDIFFKTYTEKVWAVACRDLSADWATQRIRGLSLKVAIKNAFGKKQNAPKTLAEEFYYPRTGPGEFYQRLEKLITNHGTEFSYGQTVVGIRCEGKRAVSLITEERKEGKRKEHKADHIFSTMPLPLLVRLLSPRPPAAVLEAADRLQFRSFIVINVILNREFIFPDQWLYIQDEDVKMGRIQNYKNWSPGMVADAKKTSLGLEYFCTQGDEFWNMNNPDMINFAMEELEKIGIAKRRDLINGFVLRCANVYPVYSLQYEKHITVIRRYLENFENLQTLGREGLFRYDNSDHALLTGIYAARNFLGEGPFDVWNVNTEKQYLEG